MKLFIQVLRLFKKFISYHRYAIMVAIMVAFIAGLPQLLAKHAVGTADRGVPYLVATDSEGEYLARAHEILDGHVRVSSPVLFEYKDSIALMPPTGELIFYALPTKLLGISLFSTVFLSKFIYPALLFFFVYLFILSLLVLDDFGAKVSAIAGAFLVTIGYDSTGLGSLLNYFLHGTSGHFSLLWNRLVNPITGAVLLFSFLWLLSRTVSDKNRWPGVIISGLILSAMPGYIFSFSLGLTVTAIAGLYFLWRGNWVVAIKVYVSIVLALAVNIFYLSGVVFALKSNVILSDPRKSGMFLTHEPVTNILAYLTLGGIIVCFLFFYRKDSQEEGRKRWWFFTLAVVLACLAVYNQQIITGRTVWPQHFAQFTKPLVYAVVVIFLHNILRPRLKFLWRLSLIMIFVISALCGWRVIATAHNTFARYADLQTFSGVMDYLSKNAPRDCVVYVSSDYRNDINRFIPAFTDCNVYHSYYIYNGVPSERIMHNYLVNLRLRGIRPVDVRTHFYEDPFMTLSYFFRDWKDILCNNMLGCSDPWLRKIVDQDETDRWFSSIEADVEGQYAEYLKKDLYSELARYRLDYFVVDKLKQPQVNDKKFPFLSLRGEFGRFVVYAFVNPPSVQKVKKM